MGMTGVVLGAGGECSSKLLIVSRHKEKGPRMTKTTVGRWLDLML